MDDDFTAAMLAVADDPAGLDRLVELAESGDVEAVANEPVVRTESVGPKGPPPFPGAVFDPGRHRWVRGATSPPNSPEETAADLPSPEDLAHGEDELRRWVGETAGDFKGVTFDAVKSGDLPPGVLAVYLDTQQQLAEQGVESLDLYRGVKLKDDGLLSMLTSPEQDMSKAASWTENDHTASDFAALYGTGKYPIVMSVEDMPADRVLASSRTSDVFNDVERDEGFDGEGEALTTAGKLSLVSITDDRGNEFDEDEIAGWVDALKAKKQINWPDGVTFNYRVKTE